MLDDVLNIRTLLFFYLYAKVHKIYGISNKFYTNGKQIKNAVEFFFLYRNLKM